MKIEEAQSTEEFNQQKTSACLAELIEVIQKHKLKVSELVLLYSNLGYSIGSSIEGEAKSFEELQKAYYSSPTIGVSMMLTAIGMTTWIDNYMNINKEKQ